MSCAGRVTDRVGGIDSKVSAADAVADTGRRRWPCPPAAARSARSPPAVPVVELPARPGRAELDPVLAEHDPRRLIVAGTDADLAAVLVRLLRTDRLHIEVAYLPAAPDRRPPRPGACRPAPRGRGAALDGAGRRRCR